MSKYLLSNFVYRQVKEEFNLRRCLIFVLVIWVLICFQSIPVLRHSFHSPMVNKSIEEEQDPDVAFSVKAVTMQPT
ncbi:hypothetical protein CDAR_379092 [Caerostris darwini]|uniref:Uncharacterized protein n=1 Tax=Caerostris darwini TaxID=1538125 RepID=A0AAV4TXY3_9ARAC|nr:hypothetical protein CDAR_379092 [Caerostris darwini]